MSQQPLYPAGAMLELSLDLIAEGQLKNELDAAVKRAHRDLIEYREATGDPSGKTTVTLTIELKHDKDVKDWVAVTHSVSNGVPKRTATTLVREAGDRLLVQPIGSHEESPDQQVLFDKSGRSIGVSKNGQFEAAPEADASPVAGKIAKA